MFFIRDCNENIVGNPKGYRTHKGAMQQCTRLGSRVKTQLWTAFHTRKNLENNLVYSIRWND